MPASQSSRYTVALTKGQGAIEETQLLLSEWRDGESANSLKNRARVEGWMSKATAARSDDLVTRVFAPRFLVGNGEPARRLKWLLEHGAPLQTLRPLFLLYAARANAVLFDLVQEVFWPRYSSGASCISRDEVLFFLREAQSQGRMNSLWSQSQHAIMSRCLLAALCDFGLTRDDGVPSQRTIAPSSLLSSTVVYLAYDLHFAGVSDETLWEHPDWRLFGLAPFDVVPQLRRLETHGDWLVQFSGELLRMTWTHPSEEAALASMLSL